MAVLVDIIAILVLVAFVWMGVRLEASRSLVRLVASGIAVLLALALRRPASAAVRALGASHELANLVALVVLIAVVFVAVERVARALLRTPIGRAEALGDAVLIADTGRDRLNSLRFAPQIAGFCSLLVGLGWVLLMTAIFALVPNAGWLANPVLRSTPGRFEQTQATSALHWFVRTFPHYTQTLPKGAAGARLSALSGTLPYAFYDTTPDPAHAGQLLANLNGYRDHAKVGALAQNIDLGAAATHFAHEMLVQRTFASKLPDGTSLDQSITTALGGERDEYNSIHHRIIWTHAEPNAYAALIANHAFAQMLRKPSLTEAGVGYVDGGWLAGKMVVVIVVGRDGAGTAPAPTSTTSSANGAVSN